MQTSVLSHLKFAFTFKRINRPLISVSEPPGKVPPGSRTPEGAVLQDLGLVAGAALAGWVTGSPHPIRVLPSPFRCENAYGLGGAENQSSR